MASKLALLALLASNYRNSQAIQQFRHPNEPQTSNKLLIQNCSLHLGQNASENSFSRGQNVTLAIINGRGLVQHSTVQYMQYSTVWDSG